MNALATLTNQVAVSSKPEVAKSVMAVCRAITPQFYRGLSDQEIKAERACIELLTSDIDQNTLAKMCELAVKNYGIARSENPKAYFDINYILTHYRAAFNYIWCDSVEIPSDYYRSGDDRYDPSSRTITEYWRQENGDGEIVVKFIVERSYDDRRSKGTYERHYTPKYWSESQKRREAEYERQRLDGTLF